MIRRIHQRRAWCGSLLEIVVGAWGDAMKVLSEKAEE
jgi:hypothetical protein